MKKYDIRMLYKYNVQQSFFEEEYKNIPEDAAKKIVARYEKGMTDGDYVALFVYITEA